MCSNGDFHWSLAYNVIFLVFVKLIFYMVFFSCQERKTEIETLKSTVQELHHENVKLKNEIQPLVNSLKKDTKKKLVMLTERLINLERMLEKQPKREVLEKQEQAISSLKEDLKVCKEQITQLERVGPQGGSSQGGIPQGRVPQRKFTYFCSKK